MHFSCVASAVRFLYQGGNIMNVKLELLRGYVADIINSHIKDFDIDASEIADTTAIKMIGEIQNIIKDVNSDLIPMRSFL